MATLYESYITNDDNAYGVYDVFWRAQTFTPSVDHIITSVKLLLYRVGSPSTITVSIRATSAGKPTGADLASGTTSADTLTTNTAGEWREITFSSGALLLASTMYAICVRCPGGDGSTKYLMMRDDASSATYTDGKEVSSGDSGTTWTAPVDNQDYMFEDWGDPQGSGEGGSILPSDAITRVTSLIHRYDRGTYTLEVGLGEVVADFGLPEWESKPKKAVPTTVEEAREAYIESLGPIITGASYPEMVEQTGLTPQQIAALGREIADIRMRRTDLTIIESYARLAEISKILQGLKSYG